MGIQNNVIRVLLSVVAGVAMGVAVIDLVSSLKLGTCSLEKEKWMDWGDEEDEKASPVETACVFGEQ